MAYRLLPQGAVEVATVVDHLLLPEVVDQQAEAEYTALSGHLQEHLLWFPV